MPDLLNPLTARELREIRESLHQSPSSMARLLGVNVNTYYVWERQSHPLSCQTSLAVRYLATQEVPKDPGARFRSIERFRGAHAPGARFGRLTVLREAPFVGASRHLNVWVKCDCGTERIMRASTLKDTSQCGRYCTHRMNSMPASGPPKSAALALPSSEEEGALRDAADILDATPAELSAQALRQLQSDYDDLNDEVLKCDDLSIGKMVNGVVSTFTPDPRNKDEDDYEDGL